MTDALMDPLEERRIASELFNHVWSLLDLVDRTPAQDEAMIHAAHASRWHWGRVGGPEQMAVGEWQCSRVYAVLGRPEPALHHARRCLELSADADPFVQASAHEAMARALAIAGDVDAAKVERNIAYAIAVDLEDDDDRGVIEGDLGTLPI
jgi:hypothetical protein